MSVKLGYSFATEAPVATPFGEPQLDNPLFGMLAAIAESGSLGLAATRLGVNFRQLWTFLKTQEAGLGQPLLAGHGPTARLSAFGERVLRAERRMLARFVPEAESLAARVDRELQLALDPDLALLGACASHDPLFGALRERVRRQARVLLDIDYVSSTQALQRLNDGLCGLAGLHLPLADEALCRRGSLIHFHIGRQLRLGDHKLIRFTRREQGLMFAAGNPLALRSLRDLTRPEVRFVNRAPGSGTRLLLEELLARYAIAAEDIAGYDSAEATHLAVAAAVSAGDANCGFGLRAAAVRFGLEFQPLIEEQYFLVCRKPQLDDDEIRAVREALQSEGFRRLAATLPGYDCEDAGEVVSLRRTLPWYK